MQTIALALVVAGAVGLFLWRGVSLFNSTFRRKDL